MDSTPVRGTPRRRESLPLKVEQVTADWLTRTVQLQYPGVVAETMRITRHVPGHTTKLIVAAAWNKAGRDAGLPPSLCIKANLTGNPLSSPVCVNEAKFYQLLRSRLPLPAPVCYYADWDDGEGDKQGLVILEDLTPRGGSWDTSARAITLDQMAAALEGLAALHGSTWAHPELDRQPWLETSMGENTVTDDYWSMMEAYFDRHNRIPERLAIFPKWMAEDPNRLREAWRQMGEYDRGLTTPRCLVHGDSHLGNTYGLPDGRRLWLDWQIVRKGRPWRDYSYFVIGSISIEDRRKAERDLLRHYLDHMARHGVKLDFHESFDEYRRWVIWGLVGWQSNINPNEETMPPLERFCRAADDLRTDSFYNL